MLRWKPYKFGETSLANLATLDIRLQDLLKEAIKYIDFTIVEGYRDRIRQEELFEKGLTKARFGESKHNVYPSLAVDIAPYPSLYKDREQFIFLAGHIMAIGKRRNLLIRWGGDWDRDNDLTDNNFDDLPHFELTD